MVAALHGLFLAPMLLGAAARTRPFVPDMPGNDAGATTSTAPARALVLIDVASIANPREESPLQERPSFAAEPTVAAFNAEPALPIPSLEDVLVEDSELPEAAGDTEGHALMYGRYLGQVSARIERAWLRPRVPLDTQRFECQTNIEQDRLGRVLSVELRHCDADARWQRSLVAAIERSSPLPAPPVPSVFSNTLILNFSASAYQVGNSVESEYEPEIRLASTKTGSAPTSDEDSSPFEGISHASGAIELRIEGTSVTWAVHREEPPMTSNASADSVDREPGVRATTGLAGP
jgi:hypothetical protein